jgi:hypothetical protein
MTRDGAFLLKDRRAIGGQSVEIVVPWVKVRDFSISEITRS